MAFKKEKIYEEAVKAIKKHGLFFVDDVVAYVSCSKTTFYELMPSGSEESDNLKELLANNKIAMKVKLRKKLENGDKAAEILALYKLIATQDEREALSMQRVDHTSKGEKINVVSLGSGIKPD